MLGFLVTPIPQLRPVVRKLLQCLSHVNVRAAVGGTNFHRGANALQACHEIVGDAANLQQLERVLSPAFSPTRNIGVRLSNTAAGDRMTWSVGWFNDWWTMDEAWDESGNQFTARVTGLLSISADGSDYTHLGGSLRYSGANKGVLRFRQRPESNTSSYYVDTGDLAADHDGNC